MRHLKGVNTSEAAIRLSVTISAVSPVNFLAERLALDKLFDEDDNLMDQLF